LRRGFRVSTVIERLENGELCLRLNELVGPKQGDYQYYEVMMKLEAELLRLAKLGTEITPDKVVIHKDELDRMKQNMAEKDRQTKEVYEIMKFEQERLQTIASHMKALKPWYIGGQVDDPMQAVRALQSIAEVLKND
jgi:hypothetical protein